MSISINGPDNNNAKCDDICNTAVKMWLRRKNRRKLPSGPVPKTKIQNQDKVPKSFSEAGCQTEGNEVFMSRADIYQTLYTKKSEHMKKHMNLGIVRCQRMTVIMIGKSC